MKPIEPGCLCMIIDPDHFGEACTAIRRFKIGEAVESVCGRHTLICHSNKGWHIDKPLNHMAKGEPIYFMAAGESVLRRIDDHEEETEKTREELTA